MSSSLVHEPVATHPEEMGSQSYCVGAGANVLWMMVRRVYNVASQTLVEQRQFFEPIDMIK